MIKVTITMDDLGRLSVDGPTNSIPMFLGLLELAKDVVLTSVKHAQANIIPATKDDLSLLGS